ncbi:uncharacterized protein LOC133869182 [Alnus glutinosa]|uniref:uncharacterized protein LOC133869182 n=1 Tax=Alnus glutinosa TaxID=3517 RepID=UPI002D766FBD|nr:uncharacterized protein LOC133869182 [Alnus glutinosa]
MKRNTGENSLLNENHPPNPNPDADGSHDKPEKQTAIHPTRADYSDDISDPHPMTDDELVRYNEQVERSAGFEIDPIPGVNVLNLEDARSGMLCSDQAIRKYNIRVFFFCDNI